MEHRNGRDSGISLIELMIVAVVLGVLSSIAVAGFRAYLVKARQTEAKIALAAINKMMADDIVTRSLPMTLLQEDLTTTDDSTPTSCLTNNSLNFSVANCTNSNYMYQRLTTGAAIAIEKMQLPCPSETGRVSRQRCPNTRDLWVGTASGRIFHLTDSFFGCGADLGASMMQLWTSGDSSNLDFNFDGTLDAADAAIVIGLPIWGACP